MIHETVNGTTCHGIRHLFVYKTKFLRIMWCLFILLAVLFGLYYISSNLREYFDYPVITNINIVSEQPMVFPAITICSLNYDYFRYNFSEILISKN